MLGDYCWMLKRDCKTIGKNVKLCIFDLDMTFILRLWGTTDHEFGFSYSKKKFHHDHTPLHL